MAFEVVYPSPPPVPSLQFIGASIPEHPQLPSNPTSTGSSSTASTNNGRDDRKDKEKGADLRFKGHAFCVVMEHVEHCSLKEYLFQAARERRKLPMPFIVQVAFDLAKGGACVLGTIHNSSLTPLLASPLPASSPPASLAYLHSMGVVHGDICPENLLLDSKRRLKIARFGAAHVESSHPVSTSTGSCRRTLSYSAPEVTPLPHPFFSSHPVSTAIGSFRRTLSYSMPEVFREPTALPSVCLCNDNTTTPLPPLFPMDRTPPQVLFPQLWLLYSSPLLSYVPPPPPLHPLTTLP
ncbi:unnamed protein product [Closterium sp. NIES-53]